MTDTAAAVSRKLDQWEALLRSPGTLQPLRTDGDRLIAQDGTSYRISEGTIPVFAEVPVTAEARVQQQHYDRIAKAYFENLGYPHTQTYMAYLDEALLRVIEHPLGRVAEICCGRGEAMELFGRRIDSGIGIDISLSMLEEAQRQHADVPAVFAQGDATMLPLASDSIDTVFMLGGIHHVSDRAALFKEVARVLKPGGKFYFREPVSDFAPWLWLRWIVYRLSPTLDHETERPLRLHETEPYLSAAGLRLTTWNTHGFFGFCLFMNSDVLLFNKLFRYVPGIKAITRASTVLDEMILKLPGFQRYGLQVIGKAHKPLTGN